MKLLKFDDITRIFNIDYITTFKVVEAPHPLMKKDEWRSTIEINTVDDGCYQIHVPETREDAEHKLIWILCKQSKNRDYLDWSCISLEDYYDK